MSDAPQRPDWEQGSDGKWYAPGVLASAGWWLAADGRWWPPAAASGTTEQPPYGLAPRKSAWGEVPWWGWTIIGSVALLVLLGALVAALGDPSEQQNASATRSTTSQRESVTTTDRPTTTEGPATTVEERATTTTEPSPPTTQDPASGDGDDPNPGQLYPNRIDTQQEDQERLVGQAARLSGYTALVSSASFVPTASSFESAGYIKTTVTIWNRDSSSQPFNLFDWRLQTPGGQVIDPGFVTPPMLGSGDLVAGGTVTGDVYFEIGAERGTFFIIYKPDPFDAARGIWGVGAP